MHPDGVKRAVIAGLGIAMVPKLTIKEDVRRKFLAIVSMTAGASVAPHRGRRPSAKASRRRMPRIEMRTVLPTKKLRDEAVEKYRAIEGGQQTLSNLAAYITEMVRKGVED
jgi:hypothetical protein